MNTQKHCLGKTEFIGFAMMVGDYINKMKTTFHLDFDLYQAFKQIDVKYTNMVSLNSVDTVQPFLHLEPVHTQEKWLNYGPANC